jgi:biopolymer transport protein ExbB/TolQ
MKAPATLEDKRPLVAAGACVVALSLICILYFSLTPEWGAVFLDSGQSFPFSVQNGMWFAFCIGLGELGVRLVSANRESDQMRRGYLPESPKVVLQATDLPDIYKKLRTTENTGDCFLPRLIDRCILQFQASQSIEQAASLLNTSIEMFLHEIDLRYNMLRYICWVIPSLGFIGTVVGIGRALEYAGQARESDTGLLTEVTGRLAVSFNGTFLALVMASILVLLQNIIQSKEERSLNLSGQYCLDNLINRLYVPIGVRRAVD